VLLILAILCGLTLEQAAAGLNISPSRAEPAWRCAGAWLYTALAGAGPGKKIDPA
jgi:hypothetical protein